METQPLVSVLMSTRNRAYALPVTLAQLLDACAAATVATEIVIIDNGSTDCTAEVLAHWAENSPVIRTIYDSLPGRSGAFNRGMEQTKSEVIIFTDDDVHVPASWIGDMAGPILRGEADAVGGRVTLASQLDRPWLTPYLRKFLAELLDVSGPLPGMVGASMAASKVAALDTCFDEELGPGGRGFADDVLFNLRLKALGYRVVGSDGPPVVHHLDEDRVAYAPFTRLAKNNGLSHAYLWHHWLHSDLSFLQLRLLRNRLRLATYRATRKGKADRITDAEYHMIYSVAFCDALLKERGVEPKYPLKHKGPTGSGGTETYLRSIR